MDEERPAKYIRILRKVANRQTTEVVIDLKDLKEVGMSRHAPANRSTGRTAGTTPFSTIS
jgi:hypothetical protein